MKLVKKKSNLPIRRQVRPGLLNREFIAKYINEYGRPRCFCCNEMLDAFMPAKVYKFIRIYCINCALTTRTVGKCNHMGL